MLRLALSDNKLVGVYTRSEIFLAMMELRELSEEGRSPSAGCCGLPEGAEAGAAAWMLSVITIVVAFKSVAVCDVLASRAISGMSSRCHAVNMPVDPAMLVLTSVSRPDTTINSSSKSIVEVQVNPPI